VPANPPAASRARAAPAAPAPAVKHGAPEHDASKHDASEHDDAHWIDRILCEKDMYGRPFGLNEVPEESRTQAVCLAAVAKHPPDLGVVPEHLLTEELYLAAISSPGTSIELDHVPERFRTKAFWLARIASWHKWHGDYPVKDLPLIPQDILSPELCFLAIKKCGMALEFVPEEFMSYELCLTAIGTTQANPLCKIKDRPNLASLRFVPERFKTYNLCLVAVSNNGANLEFVPDAMKDESMCRVAWAHHPSHGNRCYSAFKFIPDRYKTEFMCLCAVAETAASLKFVPEALKTENVCTMAAKGGEDDWRIGKGSRVYDDDECLLQYIPFQYRTYQVCLSAMGKNTEAWKHVPGEIINADFCIHALEKSMDYYDFIPEKYRKNQKILDMRLKGV
jgi:hypothetical protein